MKISMEDIKALRKTSGFGVQECKRALENAHGDQDAALASLTESKGATVQAKLASRTTTAGAIGFKGSSMVEVRCETDFVAKSDSFRQLVALVATAADSASAPTLRDLAASVDDEVRAFSVKIGEKIEVGSVGQLNGEVASYLHFPSPDLPAGGGAMVRFIGDAELARQAAQQVFATDPSSLAVLMGDQWLRDPSITVAQALGSTKIQAMYRASI